MAQDLFYTPASASLILIRPTDPSPYYWYDITSLQISGSAYDATISGSEFGGTAATARIYAYSGSVQVVSFPLEDTNLFYPPFPYPLSLETFFSGSEDPNNYSGFFWTYISNITGGAASGSGFSVYDLTATSSYLTVFTSSDNGGSGIISGHNYLLTVSGSGSYNAYMTVVNTTLGSIIINLSSSNAPLTSSFNPSEFNSYDLTFYVVNSTESVYLANQYDQCGICNMISSNVIVQSSVGALSLLKYYLGDDGYAYEILSPTSGSAITTISDATSYSSCAVVPCP